MNFKRKSFAFTLIEMMVTLSIVTLLTVMVLAYSRPSESLTNLIRDSDKMIFELRRAQNLAMLTLQQSSSTSPVCGWGIYLNKDALPQMQYILFFDFCLPPTSIGNYKYDDGETSETINLLKGVEIASSTISTVTFVPPEPTVKFSPDNNIIDGTITNAYITMCLINKPDTCHKVHISSVGQIYKN